VGTWIAAHFETSFEFAGCKKCLQTEWMFTAKEGILKTVRHLQRNAS